MLLLLGCGTVCLTVIVKVWVIFGNALKRVVGVLYIMTVRNDVMKFHTLGVDMVEIREEMRRNKRYEREIERRRKGWKGGQLKSFEPVCDTLRRASETLHCSPRVRHAHLMHAAISDSPTLIWTR